MKLSREAIFALWAPDASPWSVWAKPVLFSHLGSSLPEAAAPSELPAVPGWVPSSDGTTVIVADLAGARSVLLAELLVHAGFRPVPLFNAIPQVEHAVVDVMSIVEAIQVATVRSEAPLRALALNSPPVFLLDAQRRLGHAQHEDDFDNRSISLPTDFPSASYLESRGVARVLVLVDADADASGPATDLSHTLLRWQAAGLSILAASLTESLLASEPQPIRVTKPSGFRAIWHNALSTLGLVRSPLGGFGGTLPPASAG